MAVINVKGLNNSLVFFFEKGSFDEYQAALEKKISDNPGFFRGASVLFNGDGLGKLLPEQVAALQRCCLDNGMLLNNSDSGNREKNIPKDMIIRKTLRSGQHLHSEGGLIVWGDIHESAEVSAAKDIVVLGKLEGLAHAGCYGANEHYIFALKLYPRQLRIGDLICRSPADTFKASYPEIAYIEDDAICIKEYNSRDPMFR